MNRFDQVLSKIREDKIKKENLRVKTIKMFIQAERELKKENIKQLDIVVPCPAHTQGISQYVFTRMNNGGISLCDKGPGGNAISIIASFNDNDLLTKDNESLKIQDEFELTEVVEYLMAEI